ncbi:acyl-CoA dehydrogenase [Pseudomarimonas salicorniae]|uniref:Acyl-CoA dehydrogenase n=1 Tax=Pseudomarimonas salicorniae TaxID=2933270 RepID=A0ABT0GDX0_9GAMM|nr:acyl-CoA dehydrogenase [Lysobacter sp. CAU 1642]MCK7592749.1 acyl-CoA dehydrogenase [Lysobacter sp. CAU 1642]
MSHPTLVDRRHLDLILHDMLDAEGLCRYPRFAEHSREIFDATIDLAEQIAEQKFAPHNRKSDLNEPQMVDGKVVLIPEIEEALRAFSEAGFMSIYAAAEDGGMQMPFLITSACDALFATANASTPAYPLLARAAANLLAVYGSEEQKRLFMRPIIEGRYYGTMCLSEPHAGSSLADIKTVATPHEDGGYRITGSKMWISAGDHEMGENIVHLVLAKIAGAPAGVKGISLFIVPRFRVNEDGSRGARNDVRLAGLNHKMGQRGSVNTFLKFGEQDDCHGYLVGEPHQGLAYMFHMMNEERIGVGMGAVQQGMGGYLYSLQYARERRQGRHPDQRDPASPMLPIIEHADVRRMLLQQRAYVEGAQALGLYAASLVDHGHEGDETTRRESTQLLDLLTPIVKAWSSDWCLKANELAVQVLGGYGYTREYPVEQYYRDNRINPIHEGTNGIQALDLLGRKAMQAQGAGLKLLLQRIEACCAAAENDAALAPYAAALREAAALCARTTLEAGKRIAEGEVRAVLANANWYMQLLGHTCIAWMWLWQASAAARRAAAQPALAEFAAGKLATCRFFFATELPQIEHWARLVSDVDRSALEMPESGF